MRDGRIGGGARESDDDNSWHVGHVGSDAVYYEERHGDGWRRIELEAEPTSESQYVIYVGTMAQWEAEPAWAQGRRSEIIHRLQSVLRVPDYEYVGDRILDNDDASAQLVGEAGGLSAEECGWFGCRERARQNEIFCARHAGWLDSW